MAEATTKKKSVLTTASHSLRAPNDVWAGATLRAEREGVAINRVIIELLEGYRRGIFKLPKRISKTERVYPAGGVPINVNSAPAAQSAHVEAPVGPQ